MDGKMDGNWVDGKISRSKMLKGGLGVAVGVAGLGGLLDAASAGAATLAPAASYRRAVRKGGTMVMASGDGMGRDFFVGNSFGPQAFSYSQFVYGLWRYTPGGARLIDGLAVGYTPSKDGLSHVIVLRENIKFHDGSEINAKAVAHNLRAAFYTNYSLRGPGIYLMVPLFWGGFPGIVKNIQVLGKRTLKITLTEPRADIRAALGSIYIYNPRVLATKGYGTDIEALKAAGSGPFQLVNFQSGQFAEFRKVKGHFEEAYLDRLRVQLVPDASARFLALRSGQAHVAIGLGNADWNSVVDDPRYRTFVSALSNNVFVGLNATKNPLLRTSRDVREALARAMNRPAYVANYWGKGLARLSSQIALGLGVNGNNPALKPLPYDPAGAAALLKKAGVSDLKLSIINPPAFAAAPELAAMLQAMAGDLAKVGVDLTVKITDVPGWLAGAPANDMAVGPYGGSVGNGVAIASLYLRRPLTAYQPPYRGVFRKLLEEAAVSLSVDERDRKLKRLMALTSQYVSGIPIAYSYAGAVGTAKVRDVSNSASPVDPQNRAWIEA